MPSVDRAELAKAAKEALNLLHSARLRCKDVNLSPLFINLDPEYEKMARAASFPKIKLSDPKSSAGAIRIVRREADTVLALIQAAEESMRCHA